MSYKKRVIIFNKLLLDKISIIHYTKSPYYLIRFAPVMLDLDKNVHRSSNVQNQIFEMNSVNSTYKKKPK